MKLLYVGPLEEAILTDDWFIIAIVIVFIYYFFKSIYDNSKK